MKRIKDNRVELRYPDLKDASRLTELANDEDIASTVFIIDYPCVEEDITSWIIRHHCMLETGESYAWVILKSQEEYTKRVIGVVTLDLDIDNNSANLGYWLGKDYWGQGLATEAAKCVLNFGFINLKLQRIMGVCMVRNEASTRVLQKLGMSHEGTLRRYQRKWDNFEDCHVFSILSEEYIST